MASETTNSEPASELLSGQNSNPLLATPHAAVTALFEPVPGGEPSSATEAGKPGRRGAQLERPVACTNETSRGWTRRVCARALRWLALLLVLGIGTVQVLPTQFYTARQRIDERFNLLDDSWKLEFSDKLAHGEIAGRDFQFTYGPLHQVLEGGLGVLAGGDLASLLRYQKTLLVLAQLLAVWTTIALVVPRHGWRLGLFLPWTVFFWVRTLKPFGGIVAIVLLSAAQQSRRRWPLWLAGFLPGLMFLYSFDLGVFTAVALIAGSTARMLRTAFRPGIARELRQEARLWICMVIDSALLAVGMQVCLHFPVIDYLQTGAEIARGYSTMMAVPLDEAQGEFLLAGLGVTLVGCVTLLILGGPQRPRVDRAFGIAVFALGWLRYAVTRSDVSHVYAALLPTLFLILVVLPGLIAARSRRLAGAAALLWLPVMIFDPYTTALRIELGGTAQRPFAGEPDPQPIAVDRCLTTLAQRTALMGGLEWRRPSLSVSNWKVEEALSLLDEAGVRGRPLYCWPHQTIVNMLAGSPNVNPLLQTYAAHTPALEQKIIARLDDDPKANILLYREEAAIDGVSNIVRTPLIFRHLLDHYEIDNEVTGTLALLRRSSGSRGYGAGHDRDCVRVLPRKIGWRSFVPFDGDEVRECDIVTLKIAVTSSRWTAWLKPCLLELSLSRSGGTPVERLLPIPADGTVHEVLLSAVDLDDDDFLSHFRAGGPSCRGRRVVGFELRWRRLDKLAPEPSRIELRQAAVIRPH